MRLTLISISRFVQMRMMALPHKCCNFYCFYIGSNNVQNLNNYKRVFHFKEIFFFGVGHIFKFLTTVNVT